MDDSPDSAPFMWNGIELLLPSRPSPDEYVFDSTVCTCPNPLWYEWSKDVPNPIFPEGFEHLLRDEIEDDCPPNELAPKPEPEPEPDEHDNCSKYMRTETSRKATKITHTPVHTSTDSQEVFCWFHSRPKGPHPPPFPESPPPSPDASPLIDSIFERAPTEWGSDMKNQEDLESMKTAFLGYDASFREQTPPDIQLKPVDDETPMPAHKSVLAARSKILDVPDLDGSYGHGGIVKLPESREELEPLLEFLYVGSLPEEKMQKHFMTLFKAAYKYEIWYLWELCARHSLLSLTSSNDLEVLYLAYCCRHKALLEAALKLIVEEGQKRIRCAEFIDVTNKYPLMLKLVRMALVMRRKT